MAVNIERESLVNGALFSDTFMQYGIIGTNRKTGFSSDLVGVDNVLSILQTLSSESVLNIGRTVAKYAMVPAYSSTIHYALETLNETYHMNHCNGRGNYLVLKKKSNTYLINCTTVPYPISFNVGLIQGLGEKHGANLEIFVQQMLGGGVLEVEVNEHSIEYHI